MKPPLAVYLRPTTLDEVVGQSHLKQPHHPLSKMIKKNRLKSLLLYGPPGTGKTTLAKIIAASCWLPFVEMNATVDKTKEIRDVIDRHSGPFVLFLDEMHHLNKRFQNILLSYMESGQVICIGTTTENPYRAINEAIRSRLFLIRLTEPSMEDVRPLFERVQAYFPNIHIPEDVKHFLLAQYAGDVRHFLSLLELLFETAEEETITFEDAEALVGRRRGDNPNHLMSAYIKSLRGGDHDAALYYLSRMIVCGVPGSQVLRRMAIFCSEDVGVAKMEALQQISTVSQIYYRIGEEDRDSFLVLAQATLYLAMIPKSRSVVQAVQAVMRHVEGQACLPPVPIYLRNAYEGDLRPGSSDAPYLPADWALEPFYIPSSSGAEARIADYLSRTSTFKDAQK